MPIVIRHQVHTPLPWKYERTYCLNLNDDLRWVRWIDRFPIGQTDPLKQFNEEERCLKIDKLITALEHGNLIGLEKAHRIVVYNGRSYDCRFMAYHVGYANRPDHRSSSYAKSIENYSIIEKTVVGSTHHLSPKSESHIKCQIKRINTMLTHANIVGFEQNQTKAYKSSNDEGDLISYLVYHLGFKHKVS